jgi:V8-like Glu-specific endopeptidase
MSKRWNALYLMAASLSFSIAFVQSAASDGRPPSAGNPIVAPFKWAGYWLTKGTGAGYLSCTAQFIAPRVIILAAHCITNRDTGEFYDPENKDSVFALQYQNHSFSKVYHPICKATYKGWSVPLNKDEKPFDPDWSKTMPPERHTAYLAALHQS